MCNSRFPCREFLLYLECNYDVIDELHMRDVAYVSYVFTASQPILFISVVLALMV